MITPTDEKFFRQALRLAMNGRGWVEPNPMVGCVLVKNGEVVGEGWHKKFGEAHAEPNALVNCRLSGHSAEGATAYVTLEPCCHQNKKTPPCAPRLIEAKVARVVIGCLDPNPEVNGNGVAMLRGAGIVVDVLPSCGTGLDTSLFQQLIAPFILRQQHNRPYVTLKWAESADGKVAGPEGMRRQISNPASSALVHTLRGRSDAIVVGAATVETDDPLLTARTPTPSPRRPDRVVIDRSHTVAMNARVITNRDAPTVLVVNIEDERSKSDSLAMFNAGVRLVWPGPDQDYLMAALTGGDLLNRPYAHVLVEPGPRLSRSFFERGLVDRLWVIRSRQSIDSSSAPSAAKIPTSFVAVGTLDLAGDTLTEYLNTASPAFFAATPSADIVLAEESVARASST